MANATLWYKTAVSDTIGTVATGAKIVFNNDSIVLRDFLWNWDNALKQTTNVNPDGTRKLTLTDNGLKSLGVPIDGYIDVDQTTEVDNLFAFLAIQQVTTNLPFGRFSLTQPNLTKIGIESSATKGLGIGPGSFIQGDTKGKSYIFHFNLLFTF